MRRTAPLVTALAMTMASSGAFAGAYLESASVEPGAKTPPDLSKMWFDGGKMRSESGGKSGTSAIYKNRAMYILDAKSKSYRIIDKAMLDQMAAKLGDARKKMEASMANMPPERRAMVEKMMGQMGDAGTGAAAPKRVLKNTGRSETIAGIKCAVWEASAGGKKEEELCAAAPGSIPGGDEMMKTLKEVGQMFQGFSESFNAGNRADNAWRDLDTIKGVPILSREFDDAGKVTSENRLSSARKESIPAGQFEVPAGYVEKKMSFGPGAGAE
jgi:hypothetical protein